MYESVKRLALRFVSTYLSEHTHVLESEWVLADSELDTYHDSESERSA
jgi:hypothetical protein